MNIRINLLELASELADREIISVQEIDESIFPNGVYKSEDGQTLYYTEEAQDYFNNAYDRYIEIIESTKED